MSFLPIRKLTTMMPTTIKTATKIMAGIISAGSKIISASIGATNSHPHTFIAPF